MRNSYVVNERDTEAIVRDHFRRVAPKSSSFVVEEQQTKNPTFARALKRASKSGGGGRGAPEFIGHDANDASTVFVVECKAEAKNHVSPRHLAGASTDASDITKFAVDGVLHYAKFLAPTANVIAIAVSGTASDLRVSTFRQLKGEPAAEALLNRERQPVERLCTIKEYFEYLHHDPEIENQSIDAVLAYSRRVHNFMRDYAKLTEEEKPLVVSAILLALKHGPFKTGWRSTENDASLPGELMHALKSVIEQSVDDNDRASLMLSAYSFIQTHPELARPVMLKVKGEPEVRTSPLRYLIMGIEEEVLHFTQTYEHIDIVGQFYAEFLRYAGGDGKGLGIVLTPRHLTDLFVQLANIGVNDVVIDPCAGTGGFLIAAMAHMDRLANDDEKIRRKIRKKQLIGIEQQGKMFALCASNMILRGDGRSNLYRGSCFDPDVQKAAGSKNAQHPRPTRGLINPPYAQRGELQHELDFVKSMMDMLSKGGIGVAVVPMSCAIAPHAARERLLRDHTLIAQMSLPDELFYPVGTVTCILILRAHEPHVSSGEPTWFGFWKDDGFTKTKHKGRRDLDGQWDTVRERWMDDFRNRRETPGQSVRAHVTAQDEWCAEAYMETDYSAIKENDFAKVLREYAVFAMLNEDQ